MKTKVKIITGIEQKGMTFEHDFGYSFPKKEGRKKDK